VTVTVPSLQQVLAAPLVILDSVVGFILKRSRNVRNRQVVRKFTVTPFEDGSNDVPVGYRNVNFMFVHVHEAAAGDIPDHIPAGGSPA
jgi:hypothetical protein